MLLNTADYISKRLEFVLIEKEVQFRDYVRVNLELMRKNLVFLHPIHPAGDWKYQKKSGDADAIVKEPRKVTASPTPYLGQ